MTKGNNAIPKVHHRKHWNPNASQKGNIKTWLDQPKRAQRRRRLRLLKAKKVYPRPLRTLRPIVSCPTVRYNYKKRLGRGFTPEEIRAAGSSPRFAATIGIRVDKRRRNLSDEALNANVARLKGYLAKMVLFPIRHKELKEFDAKNGKLPQNTSRWGPAERPTHTMSHKAVALEAPRALTAEEKAKGVFRFLKKNRNAVRFMGERMARANKKAEKERSKK